MLRRVPLRAKTGLRRGKPLARRSQKRAAVDRVRARVRQQVIERDRRCQASLIAVDLLASVGLDHRLAEWLERLAAECLVWRAADVHEPLPRSRGGDPLDPGQCVLVCRRCHESIHSNPAHAKAAQLTR